MTLQRRTPLRRDTPGAKKFAAQRAPLARKSPRAPKRRVDPQLEAARAQVRVRSGGWCEARTPVCTGRAAHVHHIAGRGFVGCHDPKLLLHVCRACHDRIHSFPTESYRHGWMQRRTTTRSA